MYQNFEEWKANFAELDGRMAEDLSICIEGIEQENHPEFWRRAFVRTFFAGLESDIFQLKQLVLLKYEANQCQTLSLGELTMLQELKFSVTDKGEIRESAGNFVKLLDNLQFAFKTFAKLNGREFSIDKSDQGWDAMQKAVKIRNGIVHPKKWESIMITDGPMKTVLKAKNWYAQERAKVMATHDPSSDKTSG